MFGDDLIWIIVFAEKVSDSTTEEGCQLFDAITGIFNCQIDNRRSDRQYHNRTHHQLYEFGRFPGRNQLIGAVEEHVSQVLVWYSFFTTLVDKVFPSVSILTFE